MNGPYVNPEMGLGREERAYQKEAELKRAGVTLGPEVSNRSVPPLARTMENLERNISTLEHTLAALSERLQPVRMQVPVPAADKERGNPIGNSALVNAIEAQTGRVRRLQEQVANLISELEI